ncbi:MAG TPA: PhzF family phenazine biosynthesis protein [Thermoanaerobaculia bacterium]|nr:PhzF family phenazine biosynthesis protein [Thermoanaerobaculia bacterium]
MSAARRFVLVDVFADRPLSGNPLAVFPEADGLSDAAMQSIAREMDHAATAFLSPSKMPGAAFRLRIFSRDREVPFAGHPALGAHFVHAAESAAPLASPVLRAAHEADGTLVPVELSIADGRIVMLRLTQKPPVTRAPLASDMVPRAAVALGLEDEEIQASNQPLQIVSTGLPVLIVPVATLAALQKARPRYDLLRGLLEGQEASLVYAFTKETIAARAAAHTRAFDTGGSVEIPGAGAAAGALAAYLVSNAAVTVTPVVSLVFEQGHLLDRPSTLFAEVRVKGRSVAQVVVGGRVIRVGEGLLEV